MSELCLAQVKVFYWIKIVELECDCHRLVISVFFCHIEAVSVTDSVISLCSHVVLTPAPKKKKVLTATNSCRDNTISKIAHESRT